MKISKQFGLSLVEVLVALVISVFLLGGIVQVYVGNKATFKFTNALAEIQENGRFALETISQDLRLAREWGCIAFDPTDTGNINDTLGAGNPAGYDTDWHDFLGEPAIEGVNGAAAPDTLTIRGGKPGTANVRSESTSNAFQTAGEQWIHTTPINTIAAGDIILIARCGANDLLIDAEADIQRVTGIDNSNPVQTRINLGAAKSQMYQNDATVIELQSVQYTIANGANGQPSLFRSEFGNNQELVEGVQDLQILYGVDTDNDDYPNQYLTANAVGAANFDDVVAVRVMLLMRSLDDNVTETSQTYTFNGATVTPGDRRIRQSFTTTVALRNRVGS